MKNDLTTELLRGEQERWFDYSSDYNSEDELDNDMNDVAVEDDYLDEIESNAVADEDSDQPSTKDSDAASDDTPWFLQSEYESNLVYDLRGRIRGGTKEALIEHLTSHKLIDPAFSVVMLITFRSIMTTKEFFYALIYRYNLSPPEGLSFDEYNIWVEKKLTPIKCRVVTIMNTFLQQYWTPNYHESGLSALSNFANFAISENISGAENLLQNINENILNMSDEDKSDSEKNEFTSPHTSFSVDSSTTMTSNDKSAISAVKTLSLSSALNPTANLLKSSHSKLLDIDPYVYAQQLTIREHELYLEITMFECLDRAWGSKYCNMGGSRNISKFIMNANSLTNFVSYTIVRHMDVKKRSKLIQYFITVAEHCKDLNNFSSMTAIVSALYSSPIFRLKKTWSKIPVEIKKSLKKLNSLMDSKRNFIKYRESLKLVKDVPCIPFFGIYLSDLTFTFVGNPEFLHGTTDIINFSKRSRIVDIIEDILSFKRFHYKLKRLDDLEGMIQDSLESMPHIEKQYQLSLKAEPRLESTNSAMNSSNDILSDTTDEEGNMEGINQNEHFHHHHHHHHHRPSNEASEDGGHILKFGKNKQSAKLFG